jgi:AhpD family alkylhydroperoxidase
MTQRMKNPAMLVPAAMGPIQDLIKAAHSQGVPQDLMELIHLRVSQINGCAFCIDGALKSLRKAGQSDERIGLVSAWRETGHYTDEERAALALAESVTRLADRTDAVPDEVWDAAADHFGEEQLAAILIWIAVANLFNRLNAPIRQTPGSW